MGGSMPDANFIWLFYLPFCTWAVLGAVTYCVYAPGLARCPCAN